MSVQLARVGAGRPAFVHDEHSLHLTASTMKLVVLIVCLQAVGQGTVDPDAEIAVHRDLPSADGIHRSDVIEDQEDDLEPGRRTQPLWWLVERMITQSSNLATDLVIEAVGPDRLWRPRLTCDDEFRVRRRIDDVPGSARNPQQVSASALAAAYRALLTGALLAPEFATQTFELLAHGDARAANSAGSSRTRTPTNQAPRTAR